MTYKINQRTGTLKATTGLLDYYDVGRVPVEERDPVDPDKLDLSLAMDKSNNLPLYTEVSGGSIKLQDEYGEAYGVKQIANKPRVSSMPYLYDVAEGNVPGHKAWQKTGYNIKVDAGTEDLWTAGGAYVWPTGEMQMEVYSDSERDQQQNITLFATSDGGAKTQVTVTVTHGLTNGDKVTISGCATAAYNAVHTIEQVATNTFVIPVAYGATAAAGIARGPGVNVVTVFYLNAAGFESTTDVILGPKTAVATSVSNIFRIQAFRAKTCGNTGKSVGTISLRHVDDTPVYSQISAGFTRARNSAYRVPIGKTLYITSARFSSVGTASGKDVIFTLRTTYDDLADSLRTFFVPYVEIGVMDGAIQLDFEVPIRLPTGVDMIVSATAGNDNSKCVSVLRGWMCNE